MNIMTYMFDEENNRRLFGLDQMKKGVKKEKMQTAKKLLKMDMDISFIENVTGLSEEEILKLKNEQ